MRMFLNNEDEHRGIGIFGYDQKSNNFYVSPEVLEIMEMDGGTTRKNFFSYFLKTHPADRKRHIRMIRFSIMEKSDNDFIYKIVTRNRSVKSIRLILKMDQNGMLGTVQDITHYRFMDDMLRVFSKALEQNPNMIGITDTKGRIKYVNQTYTAVTGYTLSELYDKSFSIVRSGVHSDEFYDDLWSTLKNGEVWRGEFTNKKKDGTLYYSGAHIFPITDHDGKIAYFVSTEKDITRQKKQQEINMIQEKQAQMGEMISMIAHQWRQPLSSIGTIATLMRVSLDLEDIEKEKLYGDLEKINNHVQFLSKTVNDFRNFFNPKKRKESVSIEEVIRDTVAIIEKSFEMKNIRLEVTCETDATVRIHKNEMMQVLLNLLKNAQDVFTENRVNHAQVDVRGAVTDKGVIIGVEDNGGGIPDEIIHKIFDPYFSTKSEKVGTGLGLHMSKIIVEQHNRGELTAMNNKDGACFRILLPIEEKA